MEVLYGIDVLLIHNIEVTIRSLYDVYEKNCANNWT
jgi:hypothetical protein